MQALSLLGVDGVGQSLTGEAVFRDVTAPGNRVTLFNGMVDDAFHLLDGYVVAQRIAPVVLYLNGKTRIEGMVSIAGDAHVIVEVEAQ